MFAPHFIYCIEICLWFCVGTVAFGLVLIQHLLGRVLSCQKQKPRRSKKNLRIIANIFIKQKIIFFLHFTLMSVINTYRIRRRRWNTVFIQKSLYIFHVLRLHKYILTKSYTFASLRIRMHTMRHTKRWIIEHWTENKYQFYCLHQKQKK